MHSNKKLIAVSVVVFIMGMLLAVALNKPESRTVPVRTALALHHHYLATFHGKNK